MAGGISWKEFEAIVANLQRNFAAGGIVTPNDKIYGRNSQKKRQIDISVRLNVGGEDILIIIECKKWNRKADVKAVEAFAGVKEDVSANLGIMISTKGFTKAAHNTAKAKGINLYRYEDTITAGWPNGLETNVLLEIWDLTPTLAQFIHQDGSIEDITTDEGLDFTDKKTNQTCHLATLLRKIWDAATPTEKFNRSWVQESECLCPERPEIAKIKTGAESKLIRGYKIGRLQFEGLVNDLDGHAKVNKWKMVFGGTFTPITLEEKPPSSKTYSVMMRTTHIRTKDEIGEKTLNTLMNGVLKLTVSNKSVMKLPIRPSL